MIDYNEIITSCFWEYSITKDEIIKISKSDNIREQIFLFEKILINSTLMLTNIKIFSIDQIRKLANLYKVPKFNHEYINKRYLIMRNIILGEKTHIRRLEWRL